MVARLFLTLLTAALAVVAQIPEPAAHFGFRLGDDHKLADFAQIEAYFRKLDEASPRLRLVEFGRSANGRPMYVAYISSEENLARLEHYRQISRQLALGEPDAAQARRMAAEGKAVVWIDSGLHATEVAPAQHAPELAWRMLTDESEEFRRFRDKAILLQVPVINPDGLDMVVDWYRKNTGSPHEIARLPFLYQKYAGHDNNRDWFMFNLAETRHVGRLLFEEWFPQIVYNQHQAPSFPARIFVPPYAEPLNPNIPAPVMEGINLIGSAMKERFARENKPGVLSYHGFDGWWNGGLRSTPAFHNMHGILTETALYHYATPREYRADELPERFSNGMPARQASVFYQRPWEGGRWTVRDAIEYMLTADFAILDLASARSEHFLFKAWELARANVAAGERGDPHAWVLPEEQRDRSSTLEFLARLTRAGIEVRRATQAFEAEGKQYPAGSHIVPAGQPFRGYLVDLFEPQRYPEIRTGESGAVKRPYDVAGWTLALQMGVQTDRLKDRFAAASEPVTEFPRPEGVLDARQNESFRTVARLLASGETVRRGAAGEFLVRGRSPEAAFDAAALELRRPRIALYEPWTANMDAGWTQWLLDHYEVPYELVRNPDFRAGLRDRFDTVVLASQAPDSILNGFRPGVATVGPVRPGNRSEPNSYQRPEYEGGIGLEGLYRLDEFVRQGGQLIALDDAGGLAIRYFPLGIADSVSRTLGSGRTVRFDCPGSLLRIRVDTSHPLAWGMPEDAIAFSTGGHAYDIELGEAYNQGDRQIRPVARYADSNLLASGWIAGAEAVQGRHILLEARHGEGRVILYGFRPQFRGQPFNTFKLLLNALYHGSAERLGGR